MKGAQSCEKGVDIRFKSLLVCGENKEKSNQHRLS